MKLLKRIAITSMLLSLLTWFSLHRARAAVGGELMRLGDAAEDLARSDGREGRALVFNGLTMRLTTGKSAQSVAALLDAFELECKGEAMMPLPTPLTSEPELSPLVRWNEEEAGVAVCVVPADPDQTISAWSRRLKKFTTSRDIADIGQVRYLRAMNAKGATTFVSMSSEGPMRLDNLVPRFGDAPGTDMPGVPRPKDSLRTLSAYEKNESALLATYKVAKSTASARENYLSQISSLGLSVQRSTQTDDSFVVHGPGIAPTYVSITGGRSSAFIAMIR